MCFAVILIACGQPVVNTVSYTPGGDASPAGGTDTSSGGDSGAATDAIKSADTSGACSPKCDDKSCDDGCGGACDTQVCDDGNVCTGQDRCYGANCNGQPTSACDDGDPCTKDTCEPTAGCKFVPTSDAPCDDGDVCTTTDRCQLGSCVGSGKLKCDDGNPCTQDSCVKGTGCGFAKGADMTACGGSGVCVGGSCCSCPSGQTCNVKGLCTSPNSCAGRCGVYDPKATCQCDDGCTAGGDCCADMASLCTTCKPKANVKCCGKDQCQYDSCGKLESTKPCAFGCDPKQGKCAPDPCYGISEDGLCLGKSGYSYCAMSTGNSAPPELKYEACTANEVCDDTFGFAGCLPKPGACSPGTDECVFGKPGTSRTCQDDGTWKENVCAGCAPTYLDGVVACPGGVKLTNLSAKADYEYVVPKPGYKGFATATPVKSPVQWALVMALRYSADFSGVERSFDAAVVGNDGTFDLDVPAAPTNRDFVLMLSAAFDPKTKKFAVVVQQPNVKAAATPVSLSTPLTGNPYSWAIPVNTLKATGTWSLTMQEDSWAMRVYAWARYARESTAGAAMFGKPGRTLVVWAMEGVDFSCGACFGPWSVKAELMPGKKAQSQLWLSSDDRFSEAVISHELGHWAMSSFGTSPGESGTHYADTKVPPGMAWSEGWATFFSSVLRSNSVYYSMGGGGMWWLDLASKKYDSGAPLKPFIAGKPVQFMDENRVSAALWSLTTKAKEGMATLPANKVFWQALTAKQMNDGLYTRYYLRQTWDGVKPNTGGPYNATYTGLKQTFTFAPTLIDYLDTITCLAPQMTTVVGYATYPMSYTKLPCKP